MGGAGVNLLRTADLYQSLGGVAQGTGGVHQIVVQDAGFAPDVADDVHDLGNVGLGAALVHNGKTHMHLGGEIPGAANGADVGGDDHKVLVVVFTFGELVHEVFNEGNVAQQVIQRNVEEALDLGGMEVHGQNAVGTGGGEHVGDQLGGNGVTGLGLAILTGIAEVGDDGGDAAGGRAAAGVDHDQQLHEIVIDGFAGGLDEEHVGTADGFLQGDGSLSVGEVGHNGLTHGYAQLFADGLRKLGIGIAAENLNVFTVSNHRMNTSLFLFFCPPATARTQIYASIISSRHRKKQYE